MRVRAQMPGEDAPPARQRGWVIGVVGLVYLIARAAYHMIVDSGVPNGYAGRHFGEPDYPALVWDYPRDTVRTFLIILALDAAFVLWLLAKRSKTSLTARSGVIAALHFLGMGLMFPLLIHTSEPLPSMFGYLAYSTGWCLMFAFVAAALAPPPRPSKPL